MASKAWLSAARKLLPLSLLVLLAVTSASAARPGNTFGSTSALGSPHRVERKLFSWDGVTVDQIIAGSLGTIDAVDDDGEVTTKVVDIFMNAGYNVMVIKSSRKVEGDPSYAEVWVSHFWGDSVFAVYYKQGAFNVVNTGDGGFQNWAFGGNWDRYGANNEVVVFS